MVRGQSADTLALDAPESGPGATAAPVASLSRAFFQRTGLCGLLTALCLLATTSCDENSGPPATNAAAPAPSPSTPAEGARTPPDWFLSSTDRLHRIATVPGRLDLSPNGDWWLVRPDDSATGEIRIHEGAGGEFRWSVPVAALCAADGRPAASACITRVTDAGWLLYRTAPAGARINSAGDFPPAAEPGEWKRYFPNTGRGKPVWDGFRVTALSPNTRFAVGVPADHSHPAVVLDAQFAVSGGVLRWTPLPEALAALEAEAAAAAIAAIGDSGALSCVDGRLFSAGPAGGPVGAVSVVLESLRETTGLTDWDGSRWRIRQTPEACAALTLTEPPQALALPEGVLRWVASDRQIVVETAVGARAAETDGSGVFRALPMPVGDKQPPLSAAAGGGAPLVNRHITALARGAGNLLVVTETIAGGQTVSMVYRWERLQ